MAEYFSHDYDTRADEKVMDLMAETGWIGYGLFWGIVELLYQNDGTMQTHYKRIAYALGTEEDTVKRIIEDYGLFTVQGGNFWSESVNKRLDERAVKSEKARESANKRWEKQKNNANAVRAQSEGNAKKESKVKDKKESIERKEILLSDLKESEVLDVNEEIALSFWELFKHNLQKLNITSTDLSRAKYKNWVDPVRLMLTTDQRKKEELREIWEFLNTEDLTKDFTWSSNIRSTVKVREKFERLLTEARKPHGKRGNLDQYRAERLERMGL